MRRVYLLNSALVSSSINVHTGQMEHSVALLGLVLARNMVHSHKRISLEAWQHFIWFWVTFCEVSPQKSCLRRKEMVRVLWVYVNSYTLQGLQKAPEFCRSEGHKWEFKTLFC